jgi:hypothetical protein
MRILLAVIAIYFSSCSGFFNTIQEQEEYDYRDIYLNKYHLNVVKGEIHGYSILTGTGGDTIEVLHWTKIDSVQRKPFWKSIEIFKRDTIKYFGSKNGPAAICNDSNLSLKRRVNDYAEVLNPFYSKIKSEFFSFNKMHRFGGDMLFRIRVEPMGKIEKIYLLRNTSGDHEFGVLVLNILNGAKFKPTNSGCYEIIDVPIRFRHG